MLRRLIDDSGVSITGAVLFLIPVLTQGFWHVWRPRATAPEEGRTLEVVVALGRVTIDSFSAPLQDCRLAAIGHELHALRVSTEEHAVWPTLCSQVGLGRLIEAYDACRDRHGSTGDVPAALHQVAVARTASER